ncbi:DUF4190 domain-containing protein [Amycolatopsis sp. OK19-0408]|uniref:DUF4190 domain-containing protein n=1 Tax=Amycolatopsis iheyensis TaxID=2945988 RepID=A0A9X2SLQ4_9PSEU|nr:DUF4190 domain-containing protein [Amycolatopsis iheyensis]MCR6486488.1 DUF4190 domain-containing protein [Amycolatopsis iheyensis]
MTDSSEDKDRPATDPAVSYDPPPAAEPASYQAETYDPPATDATIADTTVADTTAADSSASDTTVAEPPAPPEPLPPGAFETPAAHIPGTPYAAPGQPQPVYPPYQQPTYQQPYPYGQPYVAPYAQPHVPMAAPKQDNALAIGALVCSILGFCSGITALAGLIMGHIALSKTNRGEAGGRGLATAAVIIGYVVIALWVGFFTTLFILGANGKLT